MGEYNKAVVQECLGMQRQEANFAYFLESICTLEFLIKSV